MLRNNDDGIAEKRNEVERINKLYKFSKKINILDIGCGFR